MTCKLQVSIKMGDGGDVEALMSKMDQLQTELDAIDGWEIDRQLGRAMDALRCPPGLLRVRLKLCRISMSRLCEACVFWNGMLI